MSVLAANDLKAANALARLDDDGSPPTVMPPTARDAQGRHVIRLPGAGPGDRQPGGDDRNLPSPRSPAADSRPFPRRVAPRIHPLLRVPTREGNSVMPEPAATRPPPASPPPRRYVYPDGSALGPAKVPAGLAIAAVADPGCRAVHVCGRR
jgi:hypothetical protein